MGCGSLGRRTRRGGPIRGEEKNKNCLGWACPGVLALSGMPAASLRSSDTVLYPVQLVVWGFTTVVGHFSTLDGAFPVTSYRHPGSSSAFTQGAKITFLVPFLNYSQILQEIQNHLELSLGNTDSMQLKFLVLSSGEQRQGLFLQMRVSQDARS